MVSTNFPEASTSTAPVEHQQYGCYIFPPPDHPLRKKQHSEHQKYCNSCKIHSSCNYCRPFPARPEVKEQPSGHQSKKAKKVSLQEFYQETPDFFWPPEVKPFMQWVVFHIFLFLCWFSLTTSSRYDNCWHEATEPHVGSCHYEAAHIEVTHHIPEVLSGPWSLAPVYAPKFVRHTYFFDRSPAEVKGQEQ